MSDGIVPVVLIFKPPQTVDLFVDLLTLYLLPGVFCIGVPDTGSVVTLDEEVAFKRFFDGNDNNSVVQTGDFEAQPELSRF